MTEESIHQDSNLKCVYTKKKAAKYVKQKLIGLKGQIDKSTVIFGYFNILLSTTDRTSRQKMSKDIEELNIHNQPIGFS